MNLFLLLMRVLPPRHRFVLLVWSQVVSVDVSPCDSLATSEYEQAISKPVNLPGPGNGEHQTVGMQPSSALGPASAGKIQPWHQNISCPPNKSYVRS
jgi:hypothetical protein